MLLSKIFLVVMFLSLTIPATAQIQEENLFQTRSLSSFSDPELDELADDQNTSKSLYAAWERMIRVAASSDSEDATQAYVSFLEERLNTDVPDWWQSTIMRTKFSKDLNFNLTEVQNSPFQNAGDNLNSQITKNFSIRQDSGSWYFIGEKTRVPLKGFDSSTLEISSKNWTEHCLFLAVRPVGEELVVAFPSGSYSPYRIVRLKNNGDIRWESIVTPRNPPEVIIEQTGKLDDAVEVLETKDHLIVYGIWRGIAYISGFQKDNGAEAFRFSSEDWKDFSGRKK